MKTCVILYAGKVSTYALKNEFKGKTALDRSVEWAVNVEGAETLFILSSNPLECKVNSSVPIEFIIESSWNTGLLLHHIDACMQKGGFSTAVYAWADCPFLDHSYTKELLSVHNKYRCEYTFAEGFPYGLTPEIIDNGTVRILKNLCEKNKEDDITRETIFDLLKTDINSFEIETYIAPFDLRSLRLHFHCGTKRNTVLCTRMFELLERGDENFEKLCTNIAVLKTLPSYYALQISLPCSSSCTYCPYPAFLKEAAGRITEKKLDRFMSKENFSAIISKISDFSGDAVISLSLWGEAMMHPQIEELIAVVLENKELSLVIETCSYEFTEEQIERIRSIVEKAGERENGQKSIYWIISVDANTESMYSALHNDDFSLAKAVKNIELLKKYFNGAVYPQFMRLHENEEELEGFYRYWKAHGNGELIIQKYDSFAGSLEDKKVADLSPVQRNPCWHLRNDIAVFKDGTVPLCRSVLPSCSCESNSSNIMGNIFADSLEKIWNKSTKELENHCKNDYGELCRKCDEYYTFNF
jgi:spiro-SPASM protein